LTRQGFLTGLIGAPIAHSASSAMHEQAARALGVRYHYQLIEVAGAGREELRALLDGVRRLGFAGVNVTFPYRKPLSICSTNCRRAPRRSGRVALAGRSRLRWRNSVSPRSILMPIIKTAGIDPVYFGVLFIINNAIGLITPPVGVVLNVVCGVSNISMEDIIKGVWPFMIAQLVVLFLMVLFPSLVMVPAKWFGG
jgi:hypothetical protein